MRNTMLGFTAAAVMLSAGLAASPVMERGCEPEPHSARNKPSGSKPVPGGGAKERARRAARMFCNECGEHIGHCECHVTPA